MTILNVFRSRCKCTYLLLIFKTLFSVYTPLGCVHYHRVHFMNNMLLWNRIREDSKIRHSVSMMLRVNKLSSIFLPQIVFVAIFFSHTVIGVHRDGIILLCSLTITRDIAKLFRKIHVYGNIKQSLKLSIFL